MPTPSSLSDASSYNIDASISNDIKALLTGEKWGFGGIGTGASISYSFPIFSNSLYWDSEYSSDSASETNVGFRGLNGAEQSAFTQAIQSWANVANINLSSVTSESPFSVGDIRVAYTTSEYITGSIAYAYLPSRGPLGGDIWLNADANVVANSYNLGTEGYHTLLHELGHALGLDHPFEGTFTLPTNLDHYKYTVMSYSVASGRRDFGDSSYYPTTPMLLDIQAIQYIYGANMNYRTGNDTYTFNEATSYYETIWDAGGTDTIQFTGNSNVVINLNPGTYSTLGKPITLYSTSDSSSTNNNNQNSSTITPDSNVVSTWYQKLAQTQPSLLFDSVAIAYNVTIENATGGAGNDTIYGNNANNLIIGGAGNDTMIGGLGNDVYEVNEAGDVVTESAGQGIDTVWTAYNGYVLNANVENMNIRRVADNGIRVVGNELDNTIIGNDKDSIIVGGAGNDTMIGGLGNDVYEVNEAGDVVTESAGQGIDTVWTAYNGYVLNANVENMNIRRVADNGIRVVGNELDNTIIGNDKESIIVGGAGNDTMIGGLGNDVYEVNEAGDVVTESAGQGIDTVWTAYNGYVLNANVENMNIRRVADNGIRVVGNELDNTIIGNDKDSIIVGGAGNDTMTGGLGADTFVWNLADRGTNGLPATDRITDFSSSNDRLDLRDLLVGESSANILNFLDVTTSTSLGVTNTEIRISNTGGFTGGNYSSTADSQNITLAGVNLLSGTNEADLLANLINQNKLIIDV